MIQLGLDNRVVVKLSVILYKNTCKIMIEVKLKCLESTKGHPLTLKCSALAFFIYYTRVYSILPRNLYKGNGCHLRIPINLCRKRSDPLVYSSKS